MAAPCDGLTLSEEAGLSQLRQRLQRDMNCLSDPDRSTRRRALTKLQKVFFQEGQIPKRLLQGFFDRHLGERLVGMLADPVEKCREMAGGMLLSFVDTVDDVPAHTAPLAKKVFAMAETRIGAVPLLEPAEEVRALLLRLCCAILGRGSASSFGCEVAGEACAVLSAALTDPFPEAKRECCSLLLRLAAVCPKELRTRLGKVLRPLVANLGHQHSKTRQMTLQALGALLLCGSDDLDKVLRELVLPQLRNLLFDRTPAVRKQLAGVLASLIEAGLPDTGTVATTNRPNEPAPHEANGTPAAAAPVVVAAPGEAARNSSARLRAAEAERGGAGAGRGAAAYLETFRAELVSLLMELLADDACGVSQEAERLLAEVGEIWGKSNSQAVEEKIRQQQQAGGDELESPPFKASPVPGSTAPATATEAARKSPIPTPLAPPAEPATAPAPAARAMCASLLPRVMPMAIENAAHWTARGRRRAVWLLCFLVRYAEEDVTPYLPQLLKSLGEASRDDEAEVRQAVDECAAAVGRAIVEISAVTYVLLPVLRGEISGESTPQQLTQALAILHPVLSAASATRPRAVAPLVGPVCAALCGRAVLSADPSADEELWEEGMRACRAVVESGLREELQRSQIRLDLLRALLWLLAGSGAEGARWDGGVSPLEEEVMDIASLLAEANGCDGAQDLFRTHFTDLLAYVVSGGEGGVDGGGEGSETTGSKRALDGGWDKGSRRRAGFEALLRSSPRAVGCHLGQVMPIFRALLHDASSEPELRLSMLALLESVVKDEEVTEAALRPHAECLMKEMVLPNVVWRAGMVAATVRKVAVAVLYTALRGNKIAVEAVYASAEQLLPALKTSLEDHEASTRQMTCLSLEMLFQMLPGALGEEPVRLIYPELLKRLDDSNDTVRRAVCGTTAAFFRATAPQNVRGTVLNYSVEQLLVHLDDQDQAMQRAVFSVLEVAASIDAEGVRKLVSAARPSHRTPEYCDRLLALTASS